MHRHSKGGFSSSFTLPEFFVYLLFLHAQRSNRWCLVFYTGFHGDVYISITAMVFSKSSCFIMLHGCWSPFWLPARHSSNSPPLTPMLSYLVLGFSKYLNSCSSISAVNPYIFPEKLSLYKIQVLPRTSHPCVLLFFPRYSSTLNISISASESLKFLFHQRSSLPGVIC